MDKALKKDILTSLFIQLIVLVLIFLGWILGFQIEQIGVWTSASIYIVALILFFFLKKYEKKVHAVTLITSFATGILIGSFISVYSKDILMVIKVIAIVTALVILVHGLLLFIPYQKTIVIITIIILVVAIIVGFIMFKKVMAKGFTMLGINYLFTLVGLLIYIIEKKDIDIYLAGSLLWAFILIFIIIIVILSEGEALSGIDGATISGPGKKKKKMK